MSESVGATMHHHHTMKCGCGVWWFDDIVLNGLGIPTPIRRDTELCRCPDGLDQYLTSAAIVPGAEDEDCARTKAETERRSLPIRLGKGGRDD